MAWRWTSCSTRRQPLDCCLIATAAIAVAATAGVVGALRALRWVLVRLGRWAESALWQPALPLCASMCRDAAAQTRSTNGKSVQAVTLRAREGEALVCWIARRVPNSRMPSWQKRRNTPFMHNHMPGSIASAWLLPTPCQHGLQGGTRRYKGARGLQKGLLLPHNPREQRTCEHGCICIAVWHAGMICGTLAAFEIEQAPSHATPRARAAIGRAVFYPFAAASALGAMGRLFASAHAGSHCLHACRGLAGGRGGSSGICRRVAGVGHAVDVAQRSRFADGAGCAGQHGCRHLAHGRHA